MTWNQSTRGSARPALDADDGAVLAIDCNDCAVRGPACGDCVVTVLLGSPPSSLDGEEQRALGVLAESGLVPPLRLVPSGRPTASPDQGAAAGRGGGYRRRPTRRSG